MEKETLNKVLGTICDIAKPGEYIILNRSELTDCFPEGAGKKEMNTAMMQLQAEEFLTVRYSDDDVFCLSIMNKGFIYNEKRKEEELQREREREAALRAQQMIAPPPPPPVSAPVEKEDKKEKEEKEEEKKDGKIEEITPVASTPVEQIIPTEIKAVKVPWKKIFLVCAASSFVGGLLAGLIIILLSKII